VRLEKDKPMVIKKPLTLMDATECKIIGYNEHLKRYHVRFREGWTGFYKRGELTVR